MSNHIIKSARKFLKTELKYEVTFETVTSYLQRAGYVVVFFDPSCGNDLIEKVGLSEYSKTVHAFTVRYKGTNAVFIDSKMPTQDKLHAMLHEAGHIYLNHLSIDKMIADNRHMEMQAEAFAYEVLIHKKSSKIMIVIPCIAALCIVLTAVYTTHHKIDTYKATNEKAVYITQTGEKYHRSSCIYVQYKDCTEITKAQAEKAFDPCMVCNP